MSQELNTSEKFLESGIKVERFFKKYRKSIIAAVVVSVGLGVGYGVYEYRKNTNLMASNKAYLKLQTNPSDQSSISILKDTNPKLYEVFKVTNAVKNGSDIESSGLNDPVIKDLIKYYKAKTPAEFDTYSMNQKALLQNLAILQKAYLHFENGEIEKGKQALSSIPISSELRQVADSMNHYGIAQ